jgi:predicted SAM-dependent methyltransferase
MNVDVGGQKSKDKQLGWVKLDILKGADIIHDLNSRKPMPFPNNSIHNIYCSHTLEHLEPERIGFVLNDFYRVVKPKGRCRIVVPNTAYGIDLYINNPKELIEGDYCAKPRTVHTPDTKMGWLTAWFYTKGYGHRIGFDEEFLRSFLERTKFTNIIKMSYNKCSEVFKGKDFHHYANWSIYFEMVKGKG